MYQRGMDMLEAAGAMQRALQAPELTQQFRSFRAEGCAPAAMSGRACMAACAGLSAVLKAAGAMHGALQAPELNTISRSFVTGAGVHLSCQNKMAHNVCGVAYASLCTQGRAG